MKPVVVQKIIDASKENVWKAITEHSQMIQWFFDNIPEFKATTGFKTWFVINNEDRSFYHLWEVVDVVENKAIAVEWTYPDYIKTPFLVVFNLEKIADNQTKFTVTAKGIEQFESFNIPEFTRESCIGGWEYFTGRLKEYLEK